jgi:hypothetical protein
MTDLANRFVRLDDEATQLIIDGLLVRDPDVVREARRWTTGQRGPAIDDPVQLAHADLTTFVTDALRLGTHAMSVTGQAQESQALQRMFDDVARRTVASTAHATEVTSRVVQDAVEVVAKAADEARHAIAQVDTRARKEFTEAVMAARHDLNAELRRTFGGDSPELLDRLQPVLEKFGVDLDAKVSQSASELLARAARQLDPQDPTSPTAKHAAELRLQHERLTQQLSSQHAELAQKVTELTTALRVQEARKTLAMGTPLKGGSFADHLHTVLRAVAAGLGDEYDDTSTTVGRLPRCKKGDGVLTIAGETRLVVEITDSTRTGWSDYLDEAERNREAVASLGLVRAPAQNGNQSVRVIGARRVVLAFDPDHDDPDLLRTVVMLLRTSALTTSSRRGAEQIATAEEKITEAVAHIAKIDSIKKIAGTVQQSAAKIDGECVKLSGDIRRLLDDALIALAGTDASKTCP